MKVLRTIRVVSRMDRLRNKQIGSYLSMKPLLSEIEESKLNGMGMSSGWTTGG